MREKRENLSGPGCERHAYLSEREVEAQRELKKRKRNQSLMEKVVGFEKSKLWKAETKDHLKTANPLKRRSPLMYWSCLVNIWKSFLFEGSLIRGGGSGNIPSSASWSLAHDLHAGSQKSCQDLISLGSDKKECDQLQITHSSCKVIHFPRAGEPSMASSNRPALWQRFACICLFCLCQSWLYSLPTDIHPINPLARSCFCCLQQELRLLHSEMDIHGRNDAWKM